MSTLEDGVTSSEHDPTLVVDGLGSPHWGLPGMPAEDLRDFLNGTGAFAQVDEHVVTTGESVVRCDDDSEDRSPIGDNFDVDLAVPNVPVNEARRVVASIANRFGLDTDEGGGAKMINPIALTELGGSFPSVVSLHHQGTPDDPDAYMVEEARL